MNQTTVNEAPANPAETTDLFPEATAWCSRNPGWQRICDIDPNDHDQLYVSYAELPARTRRYWERHGGEQTWSEYATKECLVPNGFVVDDGQFYEEVTAIPFGGKIMMVFKTSEYRPPKPQRKRV